MDCWVDEELAGWLHPGDSGQCLNVQMEIDDVLILAGIEIIFLTVF